MKRKIKNIIKWFFNSVGIIAFIILVYLFVSIYRGKVPNFFGYHFLRVVSDSMEPAIMEGECIIVKSVDTDEIKVGDIISFHSEDPNILNYLNTHRVNDIVVNRDGTIDFITTGDANDILDFYMVPEENVLGLYQGKFIGGKVVTGIFEMLSNRTVYFVVIILPILICMIESIIDIYIDRDSDEETEESLDDDSEKESNEKISKESDDISNNNEMQNLIDEET